MSDYDDLYNLMNLEDTIAKATKRLNECIVDESDLEIILIHHLKDYPEIKDDMSIKNKFIKLRNIVKEKEIEDQVDSWLRASTEVRKFKNILRQVEGRRDSLKKKISITPA